MSDETVPQPARPLTAWVLAVAFAVLFAGPLFLSVSGAIS